MILGVLVFLYALIDPVCLAGDQYVNKDPTIGACASTKNDAQRLMQKLIETQHIVLDTYSSVFSRADIFSGFTIHSAKTHGQYTLFNYSVSTERSGLQYRFVLDFVWDKAKYYAQDFIETTKQVITKAFAALKAAPDFFAKPTPLPSVPEKSKEKLIAELKVKNPDEAVFTPQVTENASINPAKINVDQYVNKMPLMGACAHTEAAAQRLMQKLAETQFVSLGAYNTVFTSPDIFSGFLIHNAKVYDGYTLFTYSEKVAPSSTYRFILDFAWERTRSYSQDFIYATQQIIQKALSALKLAPKYFVQNPTIQKPKTPWLDQLSDHLDQVSRQYTQVARWTPEQIKGWKQRFIQQPKGYRNIHEMVAVLMRASELTHGYVPRNTQLLSVLSCLYQNGKGHFLEVKTGEGKSLVTAMLAVSKVLLEDIPVDVLSSSDVLAERDAREQAPFFDQLGITVGFRGNDIEGAVEFYKKCQVVYGDANQLIGDMLRQSYLGMPTRGDRPFAALVIDEVDSLLVDRANITIRLNTPLACSESLLPFLQLLWLQLNALIK